MSFFKNLAFEIPNADENILIYYGHKLNNIKIISVYIDNFLLVTKYQKLLG